MFAQSRQSRRAALHMPVAGNKHFMPVAGRRFTAPVAGNKHPMPVAGLRFTAPVAGNKHPMPVAG